MHIDEHIVVATSPSDLFRYLSDPRHVLTTSLHVVGAHEPAREGQRFVIASRGALPRHVWDIDVRSEVPGQRLRVEFHRRGTRSGGWYEYQLEPHPGGTHLRTIGEIEVGPVLGAVNSLLRRLHRPRTTDGDPSLDDRVRRWLAENPSVDRADRSIR
jgi:hypothetical protein